MQAEKSELQKIIQTIWSSELYKIILSNPTGEGTYRKIVLNRQKKGWQAEQYTEKQVFHENLPEGKVQDYLMENMSSAFGSAVPGMEPLSIQCGFPKREK